MDFRAFLRALRGFEDAEADLLDQAGVMVIRGYIGVGWVAARDRMKQKIRTQEFQLFLELVFDNTSNYSNNMFHLPTMMKSTKSTCRNQLGFLE